MPSASGHRPFHCRTAFVALIAKSYGDRVWPFAAILPTKARFISNKFFEVDMKAVTKVSEAS